MAKIWIFLALVTGLSVTGCTEREMMPETQGKAGYDIILPDNLYADSVQVFFFRNLSDTDTLILQKVIYGVGITPKRFEFNLPAGYYDVFLWGNVATDKMVMRPPYSKDSIWFSYQGGIEPPDVFYGRSTWNIGTDTSRLSGMILLISRVELTLKNIPAGIGRIEARVSPSSSGIGANGYLKENMNPPLAMRLENPTPDSTYTLTMNCFPAAPDSRITTVSVYCYNATDELIYSGSSQPFQLGMGVRMILACSFDKSSLLSERRGTERGERENMTLEWSYDEKDL